jgi:hypothetical protein
MNIKLMKIIKFLKADLKRIIVLLIILSPYPLVNFLRIFFGIDNIEFLNILAIIVIIPAGIFYLILFGGFDYTFVGLFPSLADTQIAQVVFYLTLVLFWYIVSCVFVVTIWPYISKLYSADRH